MGRESDYGKDMYRQLTECFSKLDELKAELNEQKHNSEVQIAELKEEHQKETAELKGRIKRLEKENQELRVENAKLKEENTRLKSIINNDSSNSSTPPSADRKSVNKQNSRRKTERKQGGQENHEGKTLTKKDVEKLLETPNCVHEVEHIGEISDEYVTRYVIDVRFVPVVREIRIYKNEAGIYDIPAEYRCNVSYGSDIKSAVCKLIGIGMIPYNRMSDCMSAITDEKIRLSPGTVHSMWQVFCERAKTEVEEYKKRLLDCEVIYTDGTTISVNGKQEYIRNFSTEDTTLYVHTEKKSKEELEKIPLLQKFMGVLVHDHETVLYHFGAEHGECNAHILRYLKKNTEDSGNKWSEEMAKLLCEINERCKKAVSDGENELVQEMREEYSQKYDSILAVGKEENKNTKPKWAKKDELTLLSRLEKYKKNHLLFMLRFDVEFTNNMSERDLRKWKIHEKISGCFRTVSGCEDYCNVMSFLETSRKRNLAL